MGARKTSLSHKTYENEEEDRPGSGKLNFVKSGILNSLNTLPLIDRAI